MYEYYSQTWAYFFMFQKFVISANASQARICRGITWRAVATQISEPHPQRCWFRRSGCSPGFASLTSSQSCCCCWSGDLFWNVYWRTAYRSNLALLEKEGTRNLPDHTSWWSQTPAEQMTRLCPTHHGDHKHLLNKWSVSETSGMWGQLLPLGRSVIFG